MITIIDYGVGNVASVQNMLKRCGVPSRISADPNEIEGSTKLILPGVGAFDFAMQKMIDSGLDTSVVSASKKGSLVLGICLGAQLLLERSEEGVLPGLSLIEGSCKKFSSDKIAPLSVPHMAWSDVFFTKQSHPLSSFESNPPRFYFTHSYYLHCDNPEHKLATSIYGVEFTCAVAKENIMGVQFHPEKSHVFGMKLLTNFAGM